MGTVHVDIAVDVHGVKNKRSRILPTWTATGPPQPLISLTLSNSALVLADLKIKRKYFGGDLSVAYNTLQPRRDQHASTPTCDGVLYVVNVIVNVRLSA